MCIRDSLYSIDTSVEYPVNTLIDYAADEQEKSARPELINHIENFDQYDTIFIGYPTWWYDLPMVMYSFFDEYDFSGKTIIPFNTHNGSRFSGTIQTIEQLLSLIHIWADIHPMLRTVPVDWEYFMPFGLLHAPTPSRAVKRFLDAVKTVMKQEQM